MEVVKKKDKHILEQAQRHKVEEKELNEKISDLRLHAITTGEALIETATLCDILIQQNEELPVKIQVVEKELELCKHTANIKITLLKLNWMQENISRYIPGII